LQVRCSELESNLERKRALYAQKLIFVERENATVVAAARREHALLKARVAQLVRRVERWEDATRLHAAALREIERIVSTASREFALVPTYAPRLSSVSALRRRAIAKEMHARGLIEARDFERAATQLVARTLPSESCAGALVRLINALRVERRDRASKSTSEAHDERNEERLNRLLVRSPAPKDAAAASATDKTNSLFRPPVRDSVRLAAALDGRRAAQRSTAPPVRGPSGKRAAPPVRGPTRSATDLCLGGDAAAAAGAPAPRSEAPTAAKTIPALESASEVVPAPASAPAPAPGPAPASVEAAVPPGVAETRLTAPSPAAAALRRARSFAGRRVDDVRDGHLLYTVTFHANHAHNLTRSP
jgi:hypothetical protein